MTHASEGANKGGLDRPPYFLAISGKIGGGGRTRTYDLRIMSSEPLATNKEDTGITSAEPCKVLQDPQPPRNHEQAVPVAKPAEQKGESLSTGGESVQPLPQRGLGTKR